MEYGKTKLIDMLTNVPREGWSRQKVKDMVDTLWRNPIFLRWSGFEFSGGTDCNISFNAITRKFIIAPKVNVFSYYQYRNKLTYHVMSKAYEVIIPDLQGLHLIYFDADTDTKAQVLLSTMPDEETIEKIYLFKVAVAWIYWIPEDPITLEPGRAIYFGDSRHGSEWPSQVHWWNHQTANSDREQGLTITDTQSNRDGSQNSHAQFSITPGSAFHSDIRKELDGSSPASLPIWFMLSGTPNMVNNTGYCFFVDGLICFNNGSLPTAAQTGKFVMYHLFATNCLIDPLISAMGLAEYQTVGDAMKNARYEIDVIRHTFPHSNMMLIDTLVFQTSMSFGNAVKTRLVATSSGNDEKVALASASTGDLSGAAGYLDDEHFQFTEVAGKRVYRPIIPACPEPDPFAIGDIYYLHNNDADIVDFLFALKETPDDPEHTVQCTTQNAETLFQKFITRIKYPGVTVIPKGYWIFESWVSLTNLFDEHRLKIRVYKRDKLDVETLLFTVEDYIPELETAMLQINSEQDEIVLDIEDRLVFKYYYVTTHTFPSTLTLHMEGTENYSRIRTPIKGKGEGEGWLYIAYASDDLGSDYSLEPGTLSYIGILRSVKEIPELTAEHFEGLWKKYIGDDGDPGQDGYTPVKDVDYFDGEDGMPGADGVTPHIGVNGNWFIGATDTGIPAEGQPGADGQDGVTPVKGVDYFDGEDGEPGADGVTPHIGVNGNWYIGVTDTGIPAEGQPGTDGLDGREVELSVVGDYIVWRYLGEGSWNNLVTLASITGPPGADGAPGAPGADGAPGINGKEVELRENAGWVEWRYVGDATWTQLYEIPTGGSGGASAPTTISSTTTNSDNGTNHTHELNTLHPSAKSVTLASITIDTKGRVTAANSGSVAADWTTLTGQFGSASTYSPLIGADASLPTLYYYISYRFMLNVMNIATGISNYVTGVVVGEKISGSMVWTVIKAGAFAHNVDIQVVDVSGNKKLRLVPATGANFGFDSRYHFWLSKLTGHFG